LKEENAAMSNEESRYRHESADEVVESRQVVHGSVRQAAEPAHAERLVSRGASPLAMWINDGSATTAI
jgi:hypothetical protein